MGFAVSFLSYALILDADVAPSFLLAQLRILLFSCSNCSGRSISYFVYILIKENYCLHNKMTIFQMKWKVRRIQVLNFNGGMNRL